MYRSYASAREIAPLRIASTTAIFLCAVQILQLAGGGEKSIADELVDEALGIKSSPDTANAAVISRNRQDFQKMKS
jgi:hypothetical protein